MLPSWCYRRPMDPRMGFIHPHRGDQTGYRGEGGDGPDRGANAEGVGDETGEQCADREAAVSPQAVGPHRPGTPRRVCDVSDRSEVS